MVKTGRNDPCPCGSGKKFKKCCLNIHPREQIVIVGSPEPLRGVHYDKDKMTFMGLTNDGRLIEPEVTYSQTHYTGQSGKEKVLSRIPDKVIANDTDLLRHLSTSFDLIIAADTNTKFIGEDIVSVTGVVHYVVHENHQVDVLSKGVNLFRNCPVELPSEKFGWMMLIQEIKRKPINEGKRIAIVTDHDLENHTSYNSKRMPIFKEFYLPENFSFIYGRGDGPEQNLLNYMVKQADKIATELLMKIEINGYCLLDGNKITINQIVVPVS